MKPLWPHQERTIAELRGSLSRKHKRVMVQLPTGAGKTRLAAEIIDMALSKGNRAIFTVPAILLVDQTVEAFYAQGIRDIGVIQASHPMTDYSRKVQIASVQSLQNREIPPAHLVIVDEAHRQFQFMTDWMGRDDWASVPFVGLSATPWSKGLGRVYSDLVVGATMESLMTDGVLCPYRYFAPAVPDLTGVKLKTNEFGERDYVETDLAGAMDRGVLIGDIVEQWKEKGEDRPTLAFGVNRSHAAHMCEAFNQAGIAAEYMDAFTSILDRQAIRRRMESGRTKIVCNVGVATTGVDWDVRCIILARPLKSEILFIQIIGRGLRKAEGKQDLIVLDHSGTAMNLGLPHTIHKTRLNDGVSPLKTEDEISAATVRLPKVCESCTTLIPVGTKICPTCGAEKKTPKEDVQTMMGDLAEITLSEHDQMRRKKKANADMSWAEKRLWYSEIKAYAALYNKPDKWCAGLYKGKFGVWPNDERVRYVPPASSVSQQVRAYIKSRGIAWAKSRKAADVVSHA